jgi:signal transduction histidine kinase
MVKIVNDLLLLAEVDSSPLLEPEPVKLKEILEEELARVRPLAGTRKIMIRRQENLVTRGNPQQLKRLVGNLLDNAVKYTSEDSDITLSLFREDGWACLKVSDTGIGIAPQYLPHIFDRFYRVNQTHSRIRGGVGLGLALVREIAGRHGGRVTVTSEPGKGSTFTVRLRI